MAAELTVDHSNFNMLHHHTADVAYRFPRVVRDNNVRCNFLAVIVDLFIQGNFKADLAIAERESLANKRAGKAATARSRSVLQLYKKNILEPIFNKETRYCLICLIMFTFLIARVTELLL